TGSSAPNFSVGQADVFVGPSLARHGWGEVAGLCFAHSTYAATVPIRYVLPAVVSNRMIPPLVVKEVARLMTPVPSSSSTEGLLQALSTATGLPFSLVISAVI